MGSVLPDRLTDSDRKLALKAQDALRQAQAVWQFTMAHLAEQYQVRFQAGDDVDVSSGKILRKAPEPGKEEIAH